MVGRVSAQNGVFADYGELTPNDMYRSRQRVILNRKEKIKRLTLERREEENLHNAA